MSDFEETTHLMRRIYWEDAKGKLRAMVAAAGSVPSTNLELHDDYTCLKKVVADFIAEIEYNHS